LRRSAAKKDVAANRQQAICTVERQRGRCWNGFPRKHLRLAADVQELASVPLEEAIPRVTGVVIQFHRKHPAFLTLLADAPLSKDAIEQKHLLAKTFIDHLSEVLRARNSKLDRQDALWSAEVVLTALRGFLPGLVGRKTPNRSRTIDSLNQMLLRYLQPVLRAGQR
jgi:hypothetical protein